MATQIRCFYDDCVFNEKGQCLAATIELDPEEGCLTYSDDEVVDDLFDPESLLDLDDDDDDDDDFDDDDDDWGGAGFEEVDEDDDDIDIDEEF